jgi:glycerol kinase
LEPGATKVTFGTGSFVLMNLGSVCPPPTEGLLTTVGWQIGDDITYALEGAVFASGATIQWLRDGLGIIKEAAETGPLAASVDSNDGVYLVPAFTGLGSPWWDPGVTWHVQPSRPWPTRRGTCSTSWLRQPDMR